MVSKYFFFVKKAQRLFFLRRLKQAGLPLRLLVNFYHCTIESILLHCAVVWYASCRAEDKKCLSRVVKTAQRIIGTELPNLDTAYASQLKKRAKAISIDPTHPGYSVFVPLPSGKRYRTLKTHTIRLKHPFFPRAVLSIIPSGTVF